MHQGGGGGKADREPFLAGGQTEPEGDMGLAGAAVAKGDDVPMYSPRASSSTSVLLSEGMALNSKASRLLTTGKRAALMRRSTRRRSRSISSSSANRWR